jgi:hypothetical protein
MVALALMAVPFALAERRGATNGCPGAESACASPAGRL